MDTNNMTADQTEETLPDLEIPATEGNVANRILVDVLKPATCPKILQEFYTDAERFGIMQAVKSGDVRREVKFVTARSKKDGVPDEQWPYVHYIALTSKGMNALGHRRMDVAIPLKSVEGYDKMNENQKKRAQQDARDGAADYFNYGFVLTFTQPIRTMLNSSLGGVDKQIEKQVNQIVKTGLFSRDEALAAVLKQRESRGLEIPELASSESDAE